METLSPLMPLEMITEANTEATLTVKRDIYTFNFADSSWVFNSVQEFAHDAGTGNPLVQQPNIQLTRFVLSGSSNIRYQVEGANSREIITYMGTNGAFTNASYSFLNAQNGLDSTWTVQFLPTNEKLITNQTTRRETQNYIVNRTYVYDNNTFGLVLTSVDSTFIVAPDSTIRLSFNADGIPTSEITINARRLEGGQQIINQYIANRPDEPFSLNDALPPFRMEMYTVIDTTTTASRTRTFNRTTQQATDGTPYATEQLSVVTPESPNSWNRISQVFNINLSTGDTLLVDTIVNSTESFGTASRRIVNFGTANEFVSLSSELHRNVRANQDSSAFVNLNANGDVVGGQYSISYRATNFPTSVAGFPVPAVPTSIDLLQTETPAAISLDQNFPNPFNPTTTIRFSLPQNEQVRLAVYDILGREVAVLLNQVLPAGTHQVPFDASMLSSGHYLYRITTPGSSITRSMTLIK